MSLSSKLRRISLRFAAHTFHAQCIKLTSTYSSNPKERPKVVPSKSARILMDLYPADMDGTSKAVQPKIAPLAQHVVDLVKLIKNDALGCPGQQAVTEQAVMELQVRCAWRARST